MIVNEQPRIESLDVLVHPFFGMRNPIPYDGEFLRTPYAKVGAFIQGQFPGDMPGLAYAGLLEKLWQERIRTIADDPAHALLFVPYTSSELMKPPLTLRDHHIRALALFAQEQLGKQCIIELPGVENLARQEVMQRSTPGTTLHVHSYGEVSEVCVLEEVYALMLLLPSRHIQVQHQRHLELCGDRIEGKQEAYTRLVAEPEARP